MKEPTTTTEAQQILREMFRDNPPAVLLTMVDQLVDLACSGGMPIKDNLHEYKKLNFYKTVIVRLVQSGTVR